MTNERGELPRRTTVAPEGVEIANLRNSKYTGLAVYPRRTQPYDVWLNGEIVQFTKTLPEARNALKEIFNESQNPDSNPGK